MADGIPGSGHQPRRQIAFCVGRWRVTYTGPDSRSPRTGTLVGGPEYPSGNSGVLIPVVADEGPSYSVCWIRYQDVIDVTSPVGSVPESAR